MIGQDLTHFGGPKKEKIQVKRKERRKFRRRKLRIQKRLKKDNFPKKQGPVFSTKKLNYEFSDRTLATSSGGIGAIHNMIIKLGFPDAINNHLFLLKKKMPYFESDHILNIAYNILAGGTRLEDLENRRVDEAYMNLLGAIRIPDPTTEGDFLRRFEENHIITVMDITNKFRSHIWKKRFLNEIGIIDVDGTIAGTDAEKKDGMDISYKGIWGYHPLIISLSNTNEPLFIVNRPGNVPSHFNSGAWIDKAIEFCKPKFSEILLRGDTDFSLTGNFDKWSEKNVNFIFGFDAIPKLKEIANGIEDKNWRPLMRRKKYNVKTEPREKRPNYKEEIIIEREFTNIRCVGEEYTEIEYQPGKCSRKYRMVILRKNLAVERGEPSLIVNDVRYFFYISNKTNLTAEEIIFSANDRCDQENLIEQLKNGINAMRLPVNDLISNWAYMVIASLAWTFKAWFSLSLSNNSSWYPICRMEFKKFVNALINVPCQVLISGRKVILRLLGITSMVELLFAEMKLSKFNMTG